MAYVASMIIEAHIQSRRVLIDDCSQYQAIVIKTEKLHGSFVET
jgi:hypothetical protein